MEGTDSELATHLNKYGLQWMFRTKLTLVQEIY